jgi:DNA-binding response OmpR family regulator
MIRVLLADDDRDFLDVTAYGLRRAGFQVNTVSNGSEALDSWRVEDHDIVLLDVHMPEIPGIQVCQTIRTTSPVPVVLMSGSRGESEMIRGFQAGADDYVTKPFSIQHLALRLQAIHRRIAGRPAEVTPRHLLIEPLEIDLDSFSVEVEGNPIRLTRLEFRLLYCLAANLGHVVATSKLIDFAWGMDGEGDVSLLKTHFSHIRRKIEQASTAPIAIRAFPGAGYSLHIDAT